MDLKNILSISGKPGLFKLLSSSNTTIIVESIPEGKRMAVHSAHKISSLDDISIYTYEEDLPLRDVLKRISDHQKGGPAIDHKSDPAELRKFMSTVVPDYDAERVYPSDLKKLFNWYNMLLGFGLLTEDEPEKEDAEDDAVTSDVESEGDDTASSAE
jgi:hypothetical protein